MKKTLLGPSWVDFHTFALSARLPNMSPLHGTISKSMYNSGPFNVAFLLGWFKISMSALEVKSVNRRRSKIKQGINSVSLMRDNSLSL